MTKQLDKFRAAAAQLSTDDREETFDRALKLVARAAHANDQETKKPGARRASRNPGARSTD